MRSNNHIKTPVCENVPKRKPKHEKLIQLADQILEFEYLDLVITWLASIAAVSYGSMFESLERILLGMTCKSSMKKVSSYYAIKKNH